MRALLLAMPNTAYFFHHFATLPNLAIASLAGNVGPDHEVVIADLVLRRRSFKSFLEKQIINNRPDIVGLSSMTFQSKTARYIAQYIKMLDPEIQIALGGYHGSLMPEEVQRTWGTNIDFIIRGEGEHTLRELLTTLDNGGKNLKAIDGLTFRHNGQFVHNQARPICDLSTIDFPNRDARLLKKGFTALGKKADVVETSRGCMNTCKYCSITKMYGRSIRHFSMDRILDDIEWCRNNGTKTIFFADDNISMNPEHFERLCDGIIEGGLNNMEFTTQASVRSLARRPQLVAKALEANFFGWFLGIENPYTKKLQRLGKRVNNMATKAASVVSQIHNAGGLVVGGFIVGNPDDTAQDFYNIFRYAKRIQIDAPIFFVLTPYPQTPIRDTLIQQDLVTNLDDFSNYDALSANCRTEHLTTEEVTVLTEYIYDKFKDKNWVFTSRLKWNRRMYFIKLLLRLSPLAATRVYYKLKRKSYRDFLLHIAFRKRQFRDLQR